MVNSINGRGWLAMGSLLGALAAAGCNVDETPVTTGGVDAAGVPEAGDGGDGGTPAVPCARGRVIVLSNYESTQIALSAPDGTTASPAFLSTGSTKATGVAFALSGDVTVPSTPTTSGEIVLIDRLGNDVITWADPGTAAVRAQLPVKAEGFGTNPQDYLEVEGEAWVTRMNRNPNQAASPAALGDDILRIDPKAPAILGRIALPASPSGLPARPGQMVRIGDTVWLTLQHLSDDFKQQDAATLLGIDVKSKEIVFRRALTLKNCGRPTPSPNGRTVAIGCAGQMNEDGIANVQESGILFFDVVTGATLVDKEQFAPAGVLDTAVQPEVAWATDDIVLFKTQTPWGGTTHNRLMKLDLRTKATTELAQARPDEAGKGKGLTFGALHCGPHQASCGENVCLLADSDLRQLRRFRVTDAGHQELPAITVDPTSALGPIGIGEF